MDARVRLHVSRIATGSGDEGETSLFGGERVAKDHPAVEAYGQVDELNAVLGLVHASLEPEEQAWVERIQLELFAIGAELATPGGGATRVSQEHVDQLDDELDTLESDLPPLKTFILPSGTEAAARMHLARTVCRRAERAVVALHTSPVGPVRSVVRVYLNRLSDLLFLKARAATLDADAEIPVDFSPFTEDDG